MAEAEEGKEGPAGGRNRMAEAEGTDGRGGRQPQPGSRECSRRDRMAEAEAEGLELDGPGRDLLM